MDKLFYENLYIEKGARYVCGVDEVGRGPLAGPVTVCAVIMDLSKIVDGVDDSKKLSEKKREKLFPLISEAAVDMSIVSVGPEVIDEINILQATYRAMKRAVESLPLTADYALIDGNRMPPLDIPGTTIVKGDALSMSIAAASILAKVSRDRVMVQFSREYPQYGFEQHKGYGTAAHVQALREYGPCPLHRQSFLQKILEK